MPNRPQHPDFWLISQTLIDNDTAMDQAVDKQAAFVEPHHQHPRLPPRPYRAAVPFLPGVARRPRRPNAVNAVADIDSIEYAAAQRVLRAFGPLADARLRAAVMSLWMDAFVAGAGYQKLKTEGGQSAPDTMEEK